MTLRRWRTQDAKHGVVRGTYFRRAAAERAKRRLNWLEKGDYWVVVDLKAKP